MVNILKNIIRVILKKIVFSFGIIYGINIILSKINICIPINYYTIGITSLLGIPGLGALIAIYYYIK